MVVVRQRVGTMLISNDILAEERRGWWEHPGLIALALLVSVAPLLWPDVPPLADLPGHMGRWHVQEAIGASPSLGHYYHFEWQLIGNLGADLLVIPLAALFGLELAAKLVAILIVALTVSGFLWLAREVHGRIPPTAWFALPLAYNYAFLFGFVNFALSMALALNALALWLRLGRQDRIAFRALLFVPISLFVWLAHVFGWGVLGLAALAAELVRRHRLHGLSLRTASGALAAMLPLGLPALLILAWRAAPGAGGGAAAADWFNWEQKAYWLAMVLRDRWEVWDEAALLAIGLVLLLALVRPRRLGFAPALFVAAGLLGLVFLAMPRTLFGSNYADMRLLPYVLAVGLLAIRVPRPEREEAGPGDGLRGRMAPPPFPGGRAGGHDRLATILATLGLLFFAGRSVGTTASFLLHDRAYDRELAALDHIPRGARVVSFVGMPCVRPWAASRLEHLPAMALVRRDAFSNDQWSMAGAQPLSVTYPAAGRFALDPSQIAFDRPCPGERSAALAEDLATFPRGAFDYVWLIAPGPYDVSLTAGLQPVWRSGTSALFRISGPALHARRGEGEQRGRRAS